MHWLQHCLYLMEVKKSNWKGLQNYRYEFSYSDVDIRSRVVLFTSQYVFQAENDVVGQELQKQLQAAGVTSVFLLIFIFSSSSWLMFGWRLTSVEITLFNNFSPKCKFLMFTSFYWTYGYFAPSTQLTIFTETVLQSKN